MEIRKINHTINKKRLVILVVALLIVLSAGALSAYFIATQKQPDNTKSEQPSKTNTSLESPPLDTPATREEVHTGNTAKDNTINSSNAPASAMNVVVTADNTGSMVRIMTEINKIISEGSCNITLTQGDKTIKKEQVSIQPLSSYSTCNGWDIASSELSSGKWMITVNVVSGSQSTSSTTEVSI